MVSSALRLAPMKLAQPTLRATSSYSVAAMAKTVPKLRVDFAKLGMPELALAESEGFLVGKGGIAVHRSQAEMVKSIQSAGAKRIGPTTQTAESGMIYEMDTAGGPMQVRVMDGRPNGGPLQGRRTIVTRPGTKEYVNPDGSRIEGAVPKAERREIGHIHEQTE